MSLLPEFKNAPLFTLLIGKALSASVESPCKPPDVFRSRSLWPLITQGAAKVRLLRRTRARTIGVLVGLGFGNGVRDIKGMGEDGRSRSAGEDKGWWVEGGWRIAGKGGVGGEEKGRTLGKDIREGGREVVDRTRWDVVVGVLCGGISCQSPLPPLSCTGPSCTGSIMIYV